MLIKLESGDYLNPDRVDGIERMSGRHVALVYYGGTNRFHVTQNDLDKILEWHNKKVVFDFDYQEIIKKMNEKPAQNIIHSGGLVEVKKYASCSVCNFGGIKEYEECNSCKNFSNFQPKE